MALDLAQPCIGCKIVFSCMVVLTVMLVVRLKYCSGERLHLCTIWWRIVAFDVPDIEFLELIWVVEL